MYKIIIMLALINVSLAQESYLNMVGEGSKNYFKIDKITPNPMSNPDNIFTNFNIPDTSDVFISISNAEGDSLFVLEKMGLIPGEYQFSWFYKNIENIKTGKKTFKLKAITNDNNRLNFSCAMDFLLLK